MRCIACVRFWLKAMRLFFALGPDDATRAALAEAAALLTVRDGRPVAYADLHLTLAFLGEVPEASLPALKALAGSQRQRVFDLDIVVAGWWRRSRVVWLAPEQVPAPLAALAAALRAGAGLAGEATVPDQPHVTVARQVRHPPGLLAPIRVVWPVRDFALFCSNSSSTGPRYQTLAQWPLASACVD